MHEVTERYNKLLYLLVWSMFSWQVKSKDNKMSLFLCQMEPILGITVTLFGVQNGYEHLTLKKVLWIMCFVLISISATF